jgi:hypothetical protein
MDQDQSLEAYRQRMWEHFDDEEYVDPSLIPEAYDSSEEDAILQDSTTVGDSFLR